MKIRPHLPVVICWLLLSPAVNAQQQYPTQQYGTAQQGNTQPQVVNDPAKQQAAQRAAAQAAQQGQQIPVMKTDQAVKEGLARVRQAPFQLSPQDAQEMDQILKIWEERTAGVERFQVGFQRWNFDPSITNNNEVPATMSVGIIKFAKPDKGLFRVDNTASYSGMSKEGKPDYLPGKFAGDYWICDGSWIHIRDRDQKKAEKIQLPPGMQGSLIHQSPLPFLFGVKADVMKQRYYMRRVNKTAQDGYWIEAYPRRADDAGNYSRVQVVLDREFFPIRLFVFLPNYSQVNQSREVYEFKDREVNKLLAAVKQKLFMQDFISTKLPSDWTVIEQPYVEQQPASSPTAATPGNPQMRTAQPPVMTNR